MVPWTEGEFFLRPPHFIAVRVRWPSRRSLTGTDGPVCSWR